MKSTLFTYPFHYHLIENVFTDDQLNEIWQELEYFYEGESGFDPYDTGSALDYDGNVLKRNKGWFLQKEDSSIFKHTGDNILNPSIINHPSSWFFNQTRWNADSLLISYYDHGDYYKAHNDVSMITACIWLNKEPKSYDGGDFLFPSYDIKIESRNNCAVVFPSNIFHQVTEISIRNKENRNKGLGRYTITQFASVNILS